ncbi:hypothetical protein MKK84_29675 [Methylobacterium sp. E-065]|uniref:hypothetical protein n=1 Tax=Methylobacterium sp. E-065 TaxID=2836583 RepID=UPI001FB9710C|nr:hypothetical protein [Methylobacterium sp. E-065]MCJ2021538.1 hypothetical protein [Methylobacterium sp. E-065]
MTELWEGARKTVTVGGNTTVFEKDTVIFPDGSKVRHGNRNIGKDYLHGGVKAGGEKTAALEA